MKRRKFLIGAGAATIGSTMAVGSGSFSSVEAQRGMMIQVESDSEAYLRLESHPDSAWTEGVDRGSTKFVLSEDEEGHLRIVADAVRNDSVMRFYDVFRICNTGKECACVWMTDKQGEHPNRVVFFDSTDGERGGAIGSVEGAVALGVGECVVVGMEVDASSLDGRNLLLEEVTVRASSEMASDEGGGCGCSTGTGSGGETG